MRTKTIPYDYLIIQEYDPIYYYIILLLFCLIFHNITHWVSNKMTLSPFLHPWLSNIIL